ncbi:MAG: hypothetical protein R3296_10135 [Oleiphilaceae bacterium]|nr:hypothetical protein [Oleiphilaceae bacterium]
MGLTLLLQGLITLVLLAMVLAGYHFWLLRPELDRRDQALAEAHERSIRRIEAAMNERFDQLLAEQGGRSLAGTTRQFMRYGSELMEGGLSALLNEADYHPESGSGRKTPRQSR